MLTLKCALALVFRRVLMTLKPDAFEACFNAWIARLRDECQWTRIVTRLVNPNCYEA